MVSGDMPVLGCDQKRGRRRPTRIRASKQKGRLQMRCLLVVSTVLLSVCTACYAEPIGGDPFADQIATEKQAAEAKVQAEKKAAAELKEKNSLTVPADLLAKMGEYEWVSNTGTIKGKLVKIYHAKLIGNDDRRNDDWHPAIMSFVVRGGNKDTEVWYSRGSNVNSGGFDQDKYLELVVKKLWANRHKTPRPSADPKAAKKKLADKRAGLSDR